MALAIQSGTLTAGEQRVHQFASTVRAAGVTIQGYTLRYTRDEEVPAAADPPAPPGVPEVDHHVQSLSASVAIISTSGDQVTVRVDGEIRDGAGNIGPAVVTYAVIVDTD
jgi:hypothetical protein